MGAREIADGLKKARFRTFSEANEALAPLRDHAKRLYAAGGPTILHEAIQAAVIDLTRSIGRLRDRIEGDALTEAARANGLPVGKKMDMIAALAKKGIQPDAS